MYSYKIRRETKNKIKADQFNFYLTAILATLTYFLLAKAFTGFPLSGLITIMIYGISIMIPEIIYYSALNNEMPINYNRDLLEVVDGQPWKYLLAAILRQIYIALWTLLFIIPGIIKKYSYALTPYILADNPEMDANEAIQESSRLMRGNKMSLLKITIYYDLLVIFSSFLVIITGGLSIFTTFNFLLLSPVISPVVSYLMVIMSMILLQTVKIYIMPYTKTVTAMFYIDKFKNRGRTDVIVVEGSDESNSYDIDFLGDEYTEF